VENSEVLVLRRTVLVLLCWSFGVGASMAATDKANNANLPLALALLVGSVVALVAAARTYPPEERHVRALPIVFSLILFTVSGLIVYPVLLGARAAAGPATCLSNQGQVALGLLMYANDNDDHFPEAQTWFIHCAPYYKSETLRCPEAEASYTYGMNRSLSKQKQTDSAAPDATILTYETASNTPNPNGGPESFVPRHNKRGTVSFTDGHAKLLPDITTPAIHWKQ